MGTAALACASLKALSESPDFSVVGVVTQPDRPKGRDLKLQPSPVKELASQKNLPVFQPERARHETFIQQLRDLAPDLIVVAAYGQILPQSILDLPRFGCLNIHTSLLPKYRGAAPIQWAILDGEIETGVTIMKMDAGLDTGDIVSIQKTPITVEDNSQTLHDRLAEIGAALLLKTIPGFISGEIVPQKQPAEGASYARKIEKTDGLLDWNQPARILWNRIRGLTPWPGAFTFQNADGKSRLLKIWQAAIDEQASGVPGEVLSADKAGILIACGSGALRISQLQREGGKRMSAQEFATGKLIQKGEQLRSLQ
jgi:methionyl-tRNA formyltransferase